MGEIIMVQARPRYGVVRDASGQWVRAVTGEEYYSTVTERVYASRARAEFAERQSKLMKERYEAMKNATHVVGVIAYDDIPNGHAAKKVRADDSDKFQEGLEKFIEGVELQGGFNAGQSWYGELPTNAFISNDYVPVEIAKGGTKYGEMTLAKDKSGAFHFYKANGATLAGMSAFGTVLVYEGMEVQP